MGKIRGTVSSRGRGFSSPGRKSTAAPRDIASLYKTRRGSEHGCVLKERGGRLSVALAYPNSYSLGMSNLGFQAVYRLLNDRADVVAERVFLPEGHEMSLYLQSGKPLLSLESLRPLNDFHVVAFSLSFEQDYLNVLKMLEMGNIPIPGSRRAEYDPLVAAGGVATSLNPEPIADFIDVFVPGDAEVSLAPFLDGVIEIWKSGACRRERLDRLAAEVPTIYVPSCYAVEYDRAGLLVGRTPLAPGAPEIIRVRKASGLDLPVASSAVISSETEFSDMLLVETGRGCGRSCRFCAAGYVYRPPRFHSEASIREIALGPAGEGRKIGLVGAAVSDVPGIESICSSICDLGGSFSLSSLRADNITSGLVELLALSGQRSLSIAPEAGSERLRGVINKHLTEEQLISAVKTIAGAGDFSIKLYALIGLPTETAEDRDELIRLVKEIKKHMVKASASRGTIGRIKVNINSFVPKPFTPFQWTPFERIGMLEKAGRLISRSLGREGGIDVSRDVPGISYVQALLSVGDRRVADVLHKAHGFGGNWKKALKFSDVPPDFFVHRKKGVDDVLPWDFLDHGISKSHLKKEYFLAMAGRESDVCRPGACARCGVCPT